MKHSLLSLKILIGFYIVLALLLLLIPIVSNSANVGGMIFTSIFTSGWAYFHYKVRSSLMLKKYWAWIVSIIIFGMTTLSILFPLGILGLMGVLKKETRHAFARNDLGETGQNKDF